MPIREATVQAQAGTGFHAAQTGACDPAFEARWAAWIARGLVHEQRARRRFAVWAGALAVGAAVGYLFLF